MRRCGSHPFTMEQSVSPQGASSLSGEFWNYFSIGMDAAAARGARSRGRGAGERLVGGRLVGGSGKFRAVGVGRGLWTGWFGSSISILDGRCGRLTTTSKVLLGARGSIYWGGWARKGSGR